MNPIYSDEVTGGDRVFYIPDENQLKVVVFMQENTFNPHQPPKER
jgi:hypothetical protein